jgi:hypothetical protein
MKFLHFELFVYEVVYILIKSAIKLDSIQHWTQLDHQSSKPRFAS